MDMLVVEVGLFALFPDVMVCPAGMRSVSVEAGTCPALGCASGTDYLATLPASCAATTCTQAECCCECACRPLLSSYTGRPQNMFRLFQ